MNKKLVLFLVLPLLILVGVGGFLLFKQGGLTSPTDQAMQEGQNTPANEDLATVASLGVPLLEQNGSTQMGGVGLVENEGKVTVTIDVTDIGDTDQPAHIHLGSCPTPGEVQYSLTPVKNGKSVTVLEITMKDILTELPMAVNIHKSAQESSVYTACGDIVLPTEE